MKKHYFLVLLVFAFALLVNAQRNSTIEKTIAEKIKTTNSKATCDTLFDNLENWSQPTIFGVTPQDGGGWVAGHNGYGDKQKAQKFVNTFQNGLDITGTILWFGAKRYNSGNPNSRITVHVYNLNGTGNSSSGLVSCPNTKIANKDLLISAIDTGSNWNIVMFPSPTFVSGDFAVGIDLTTSAVGDSVGLVSSEDGGALFSDMSWDQFSDNSWNTALEPNNWGLNIDYAIFPIYCEVGVGMLDQVGFINGMKFSTFPNPAVETINITYETQLVGEVIIEIRDLTGKQVYIQNEGLKTVGGHTASVNAHALATGNYIIALKVGNKLLAQNLHIQK